MEPPDALHVVGGARDVAGVERSRDPLDDGLVAEPGALAADEMAGARRDARGEHLLRDVECGERDVRRRVAVAPGEGREPLVEALQGAEDPARVARIGEALEQARGAALRLGAERVEPARMTSV